MLVDCTYYIFVSPVIYTAEKRKKKICSLDSSLSFLTERLEECRILC